MKILAAVKAKTEENMLKYRSVIKPVQYTNVGTKIRNIGGLI